jgi:nucleoside-diphosphate-sugar epimerase
MPSSDELIVITGASGLIGQALTRRLIAAGKKLRLQVRNKSAFLQSAGKTIDLRQAEIVQMDFNQVSIPAMVNLVSGASALVHAAGLVHNAKAEYSEYELLNVRTTEQLADIAASQNVGTFVFLSTSAVYGPGPFADVKEDAQLKPQTAYAVSKARCESHLQTLTGKIKRLVVLRPSLVFGEGDRGNLLSLIKQINNGRYFNIAGQTTYKSLIYSLDLAQIIELCLKSEEAGYFVFNAANPQAVELSELTKEIALALGRPAKSLSLPSQMVRMGAKAAEKFLGERSPITESKLDKLITTTTCSADNLVRATGFTPQYSLKESLAAEIKWATAQGLL